MTPLTISHLIKGVDHTKEKTPLEIRSEQYESFLKRVQALIAALKKHRESIIQQRHSHHELFRQLAAWTEGTPLFSTTGGAIGPSYGTTIEVLDETGRDCELQYQDRLINYAKQWEKLVTKRYKSSLNELGRTRQRLESCQEDMDRLHGKRATTFGKGEGAARVANLKKKHDQLERIKNDYKFAEDEFCAMVDELTDDSWKKMYPFLVKLFEYEQTSARERAVALTNLDDVMDRLQAVADTHELTLEHLEDQSIAELTPSECNSVSSTSSSKQQNKPHQTSSRTWKSKPSTTKSSIKSSEYNSGSSTSSTKPTKSKRKWKSKLSKSSLKSSNPPSSVASSDAHFDPDDAISADEWSEGESRLSIWRHESGWSDHHLAGSSHSTPAL